MTKLAGDNTKISKAQGHAILGSALVGSLAFSFTDSFWFNAVETEVYAMATLIMSILFYLGLRWEQILRKRRRAFEKEGLPVDDLPVIWMRLKYIPLHPRNSL